MELEPLKNLHEVLSEAATEIKKNISDYPPTSVRLGEYGEVAASICKEHGINLSQFLRKCCETLAQEYLK